MKKQAFNPYLPSYEYVPDGEPHVFGDRLYIYGSHDKFNGKRFCENDLLFQDSYGRCLHPSISSAPLYLRSTSQT